MTDLPSLIQGILEILENQQVEITHYNPPMFRILGIATTAEKIMEAVSAAIVSTDIISVRQRRDLVQFLRRPDAAPARERSSEKRAIDALVALVDAHDYLYLDRGMGTATDEGKRWIEARSAVLALLEGK